MPPRRPRWAASSRTVATITNASGAISVTYGNTANTALQGTAIPSVVTGAPVCGTGSAGAVGACGGYLIPTAYLGGRYIDAYVPGATKGSVVPTGTPCVRCPISSRRVRRR